MVGREDGRDSEDIQDGQRVVKDQVTKVSKYCFKVFIKIKLLLLLLFVLTMGWPSVCIIFGPTE